MDKSEIIDRLDGLRVKWWLFTTLCTFVMAGIASLLLLTLLVLIETIVPLPRPLLAAAFTLWCVTSAALVVLSLTRCIGRQRTLEAAARRVEQTFPELDNSLISLVQWDELPEPVGGFQQLAIQQATRAVADVPLETAAARQDRKRRWRLGLMTPRDLLEFAAVLMIQLAILGLLSRAPRWSQASDRLWRSFSPEAASAALLAEPASSRAAAREAVQNRRVP